MSNSPLQSLSRGVQYLGAGLAAWRSNRSSGELNREKAQRHLAQRLGRLRGLPQKLGQWMSMGDLEDESNPLAELRGAAEPIPWERLAPILEDAWKAPPSEICRWIDPKGLAASLGQVHRATRRDGLEVAIKIQYPGIADSIEGDLRALGWLSKPVGNLRAGFDLEQYRAVIREGLEEELDYEREAENQQLFQMYSVGLGYVVPNVLPDLSGAGVLTTAWQDGESLESVAREWSEADRSRLGMQLVEQFLEMGLVRGLLHGDPHPGNYRFRREENGAKVVLYDFGCLCRLSERERDLLLCLIRESVDPDSTVDPFGLLVALGFEADLLDPLRHKLPALCRILFEPFGPGGKYDFARWKVSERLEAALGSDRMNFRIAGPAKLVPFLRAFTGLAHALKTLAVPVFWAGPLARTLAKRPASLQSLELPAEVRTGATFSGIAKHLRIRVQEDGAEKVSLAMPASAVDRLHELLDPELEAKIRQRGIDVNGLVQRVRENLYAPQEVFTLQDGNKRVTVSLE